MNKNSNNCFDEIRFLLALIVLVAHTRDLSSQDTLIFFTKNFDANFAVKGFFAISGYLVTKSFLSSNSYFEYLEKRVRRIYPAYVFVIIYSVMIGFFTSNLKAQDFFLSFDFTRYIFANLSFLNFLQPNIADAMQSNKIQALNGSLWTIKIELMLYLTVPALIYLYRKFGINMVIIISFFVGFCWHYYFTHQSSHPLALSLSRQFPSQLPYFTFGSMLVFINIKNSLSLGVIIMSVIYYYFISFNLDDLNKELINMFLIPLTVITIACSNLLSVNIKKYGDLSYGIYLFHFPTIQFLEYFGAYKTNFYVGFLLSIAITLGFSFISWHIVEKKFLKSSSHYLSS